MFRDYGKIAFMKVTELEKKFDKLQKELLSSINNTLSFDLVTPEKRAVFSKEFSCNAKKGSIATLKIDFESDITLDVNYLISVNGNYVNNGKFVDGKGVLELQTGVGEGKLNFKIELTAPISYSINKLFIMINGNVEYINEFSRLSVITAGQVTYVTAVNRGQLSIYSYDKDGLYEIYKINDVKDGSIGGYLNDELYILYIDASNDLRVLIYDVNSYFGVTAKLDSRGATSVCGYTYGDGIKVFYVLTGNVYCGDYVKYGTFNGEKINRRGVKVSCDPNVAGVYVISDASNSNKLVTENGTYVLARGYNHHVIKNQVGYVVTYSDKNVLYAQEVSENLGTPEPVDYCDEKVLLYDGKFLVRVIDSLKIRKD